MSNTSISVIIPTCHRNDLLAKCLDCLAPGVQILPAEQYEVIVTDDGSKSTAEEMVREQYPWARWISGPRKGPAANRNNGARVAKGEWLAFTDDDCLPVPKWLAAFCSFMSENTLALEGAILPVGNPNKDLAECPINVVGGCFWSANIIVKKSLFNNIKGFDSSYPIAAHEDQDLKIRVEQYSKIQFVAEAIVLHPVRVSSIYDVITRMPQRGTAFARHANKHISLFGNKSDIRFLSSQYLFHLKSLKHSISRGHPKSAFCSFIVLVVGVPIIYIYFRRMRAF